MAIIPPPIPDEAPQEEMPLVPTYAVRDDPSTPDVDESIENIHPLRPLEIGDPDKITHQSFLRHLREGKLLPGMEYPRIVTPMGRGWVQGVPVNKVGDDGLVRSVMSKDAEIRMKSTLEAQINFPEFDQHIWHVTDGVMVGREFFMPITKWNTLIGMHIFDVTTGASVSHWMPGHELYIPPPPAPGERDATTVLYDPMLFPKGPKEGSGGAQESRLPGNVRDRYLSVTGGHTVIRNTETGELALLTPDHIEEAMMNRSSDDWVIHQGLVSGDREKYATGLEGKVEPTISEHLDAYDTTIYSPRNWENMPVEEMIGQIQLLREAGISQEKQEAGASYAPFEGMYSLYMAAAEDPEKYGSVRFGAGSLTFAQEFYDYARTDDDRSKTFADRHGWDTIDTIRKYADGYVEVTATQQDRLRWRVVEGSRARDVRREFDNIIGDLGWNPHPGSIVGQKRGLVDPGTGSYTTGP